MVALFGAQGKGRRLADGRRDHGVVHRPMIVPGHYTLDEAAASESTQAFLLVGTLVLLPVILFYTGWSYWVFRGKVRADSAYH